MDAGTAAGSSGFSLGGLSIPGPSPGPRGHSLRRDNVVAPQGLLQHTARCGPACQMGGAHVGKGGGMRLWNCLSTSLLCTSTRRWNNGPRLGRSQRGLALGARGRGLAGFIAEVGAALAAESLSPWEETSDPDVEWLSLVGIIRDDAPDRFARLPPTDPLGVEHDHQGAKLLRDRAGVRRRFRRSGAVVSSTVAGSDLECDGGASCRAVQELPSVLPATLQTLLGPTLASVCGRPVARGASRGVKPARPRCDNYTTLSEITTRRNLVGSLTRAWPSGRRGPRRRCYGTARPLGAAQEGPHVRSRWR